MLDKKQEYIAESLDEIRDEYIDEAVNYEAVGRTEELLEDDSWIVFEKEDLPKEVERTYKKIYRIVAPVATCFVLIVGLSFYSLHSDGFGTDFDKFGGVNGEAAGGTAGGAAAGDVANDSTEISDSASPGESNMEENVSGSSQQSIAQWMAPEEIFARDIVIFRGTVQSVTMEVVADAKNDGTFAEPYKEEYTVITVEVKECLKGELKEGEVCEVRIPGDISSYYSSLYGDLSKLQVGDEGVFMPSVDEDGRYYYNEGIRFLFLQTDSGVSYAEDVYDIPSQGEVTLDDVVSYIKTMLEKQ